MDDNQSKEGVSVKEIETFAKKHRFEFFFCLAFALAFLFALIMYSSVWSIGAAALGGILGVLFPGKVAYFSKKAVHFLFRQEKTTQFILAIVLLILAIFLPPLIFLLLGLHGGKDIYHMAREIQAQNHKEL
jgi:ABC-type multidrug transport system fused ATPase/permease subunit